MTPRQRPGGRPTVRDGPPRLARRSDRLGLSQDARSGVGGYDACVYLLRCRDGSLYTGWTSDLARRLEHHRAGKASRYTASRLPIELVLACRCPIGTQPGAKRHASRRSRAHASLPWSSGPTDRSAFSVTLVPALKMR